MYQTKEEKLKEKAILVGAKLPLQNRDSLEESLEELKTLTQTAGAGVIQIVIQERERLNPAFLIGKGKVEEIRELCEENGANIVIFDEDLSPAQINNLREKIGVKVIDRSSLILDIFAKRARTKEAKAQVELAQLKYLLPRLTGRWEHFSRQYGGIGTKGPGETQLEVDRRQIRKKISELEKTLEKIDKEKKTQRRKREELFKVALVGYTNVGKSTLFNCLTEASILVDDKLFATLDSTTRLIKYSSDFRVVLTDTVGFIRNLPHHLVASFRSTLDEVRLADLLLLVVDLSHPQFAQQTLLVKEILEEMDCQTKAQILVYNKIDCLNGKYPFGEEIPENEKGVFISAEKNIGIISLIRKIEESFNKNVMSVNLKIPISDTHLLSLLQKMGRLDEIRYFPEYALIKFKVERKNWGKLAHLNPKVEIVENSSVYPENL